MLEQVLSFVIAPLVAGFAAWFFTRKKHAAEVEAMLQEAKAKELDNVDGAVAIWRNLAEGLRNELADLKNQYNEIKQQNIQLLEKFTALEADYRNLHQNYEELKQQQRT